MHPIRKVSRLSAAMVLLLCGSISGLNAGIHIRGEQQVLTPAADLQEFQNKQLPFLRGYGPPDVTMSGKPTTQRTEFLKKVEALQAKKTLTADEQADLGGYLLYLKIMSPRQPAFEEAIAVMESAYASNPRHFGLAANLGTAYQLSGKLDAAERCLQNAVDLAPAPLREMEQLHLRLVQRRLRENLPRNAQPDLDLLFGKPAAPFRYVGVNGLWVHGNLAKNEVDKLPAQSIDQAVHQIKQLLVWLPDDGRLHWQLAEMALAAKQPKVAFDLFQQCVDTFRLSHVNLKQHRSLLQEANHWLALVEKLGKSRSPEAWLVQTLGQGLPAGESFALGLIQVSAAIPPKRQASDLFNGGGPIGDVPAVPQKPFVIQPWHWVLIVLGSILAALMLYWQMSEWFVRLFKSRTAA